MKVFDNVASLKLAKLTAGQVVQTKGYYTAGDGGGVSYLIKTAAQYAATPDEYGDHTLANTNVAVLQSSDVVNVKQFGAGGDGVVNDYPNINAASSYCETNGTDLLFPPATYYTGTGLLFKGKYRINAHGAVIKPDATILIGVQYGDASTAFGGAVFGLECVRAAYSGVTENVGFRYYHCAEAEFFDTDSRNSKYGEEFSPDSGKFVAYCNWYGCDSINNLFNIRFKASGTGFNNQNNRYGGRLHGGLNTYSHIVIEGVNAQDNNWFNNVSMEQGAAGLDQAVLAKVGGYNGFNWCRTEGDWNNRVLNVSSVAGTFQEGETVTGGTSGATGVILAFTATEICVGEIVGTFSAAETITGGTSAATATVDVVPTSGRPYVFATNANRYHAYESFRQTGTGTGKRVFTSGSGTSYETPDDGYHKSQDAADSSVSFLNRTGTVSAAGMDNGVQNLGDTANTTTNLVQSLKVRVRSTAAYFLRGFWSVDGTELFSINTWGGYKSGNSGWDKHPLTLGSYYLWVDATGDLRIKNGAPASDTDGTVVGTQT
jgi:hypothetical protein